MRKLIAIALLCLGLAGLASARPGPDSNYNIAISGGGASPSYTYPISAGLYALGGGGATNTLFVAPSGSTLPILGSAGSAFVLLAFNATGGNAGATSITLNGTTLTPIQDDGSHDVSFFANTVTLTGTGDSIVINSAAGAFNFLDLNGAVWVMSNLTSTTKISSAPNAGPLAASANNFLFVAENGAAGTWTAPTGINSRAAMVGGGSGTTLVVGDKKLVSGDITGGNVTATFSAGTFGVVAAVWD